MTVDAELQMIWSDIEEWLREHAPARAQELRPGADAETVAALEVTLRNPLPPDYAASLRIHDGKTGLTDYTYMSIEQVIDTWARLNELSRSGAFANRTIDDPSAGIIQPRWWTPSWIPFAEDGGGNLLCLDLEPGPHGTYGQVLRFERTMGPGPAGWASFQDWLASYRDRLKQGVYFVDEDGFIRERM
jgi:cell wall assembly regulator SMI1